jgi:hypothetical protein
MTPGHHCAERRSSAAPRKRATWRRGVHGTDLALGAGMNTLTFSTLAVAVVLVAGCEKKEPAAEASASAAPAAAPPVVAIKAEIDKKFDGNYDHALYVKRQIGGATLSMARGCPSFDCNSVDAYGNPTEAIKTSCATAGFLVANAKDRGELKTGDNDITIDLEADKTGATITGRDPKPKLNVTELGADSVAGTFDFKNENGFAKGPFKAKVCAK